MNTIISLDKVIVAHLFYRNQHGLTSPKPMLSANGSTFEPTSYGRYHFQYTHETMLERARRLDIIDKWTPVLKVKMQGGVRQEFTGERALSIWEAFKAKEFGNTKTKNAKPNKRRHNRASKTV